MMHSDPPTQSMHESMGKKAIVQEYKPLERYSAGFKKAEEHYTTDEGGADGVFPHLCGLNTIVA